MDHFASPRTAAPARNPSSPTEASFHTRLSGRVASRFQSAAEPSKRAQSKPSAARKSAKQSTDSHLLSLQRENAALRQELARLQQVAPDEIRFGESSSFTALPDSRTEDEQATSSSKEAGNEASASSLEADIRWPEPGETAAWERPARTKPWKSNRARPAAVEKDSTSLQIAHISAEFAPVAKVGGLGDVVTGLARASLERGHNVEVILPFYQFLDDVDIQDLEQVAEFDVPKGSQVDGEMRTGSLLTSAFSGRIDGIPVLLLRPDWSQSNLFKGERVYAGSYNETEAYLYFSRASLEALRVTGRRPQIIHAHEWQTAAVPMLFWERYYHEGLDAGRIIFTIHNLDSQGECRQDEFAITGVPGEVFSDVNKALDERTIGHNPERLCLMKGGIVFSNATTTVSPTYASEAVDGGAAGWLKSTIARPDIRAKFKGILNGIDTSLWDPMTDGILPAPYDHDQLEGKALCKRYLQRVLHMDEAADKPIVAVITRLVPQKGIHLIKHSVQRTLEGRGQFVLLGSGHADGDFRALADSELRGHPDARLMIMYSDALAHLVYAAADIVLVPSLFEPCGLTQLVGMRYGAIPVVRSTGGLADTVRDVSEGEEGNGYTFGGTDAPALDSALDRALEAYRSDPNWWRDLVVRNMLHDSSWQVSAKAYIDLYLQQLPG